jgi:hypothetical protein
MSLHSPPHLPQEIWDIISRNLSTLGLLYTSRIFGYGLAKHQDKHTEIWGSIFMKDNWLTEATEKFRISPVIISPYLDRFHPTGRPIYMVLAFRDPTGDLQRSKQMVTKFYEALRPHKYDKNRREVTFMSGIVLSVQQLYTLMEMIPVEPTRLFRNRKRLSTQYVHWSDASYKLMTAKKGDFAGPYSSNGRRDKVAKTNDPEFCCEMSLAGPGGGFKLWFEKQQC